MRLPGLLSCLLVLSAATTSIAATDTHHGYRLAGVMSAGDSYVGLLELPQGQQVLVRLGSVVDGGAVIAFDARSLRIRFTDGILELLLEGSEKPLVAAASPQVVVAADEHGNVIRRKVDVVGLQSGLKQAAVAPSAAKTSTGGPPPDPQIVVTQRFAPLLDLPVDAQVIKVNETEITSAVAAIRMVEATLARGMPARLDLRTPNGMKRVYLMPASPGTPPPGRP